MPKSSRTKRILIFRTGHLGDAVIALPALWAIRDAFPASHITLLTNRSDNDGFLSAGDVLPSKGLIDAVEAYPPLSGLSSSTAAIALIARLRKGRYDLLFYMPSRVRNAGTIRRDRRFFGLAGIRQLVGFEHVLAKRLSERCGHPSPVLERDAEYLLGIVSSAGVNVPSDAIKRTDLLLSAKEISAAESFIEKEVRSRLGDRVLVGVAPGSKWPSKIWPPERYAETLRKLVSDDGVFPLIVGGGDDHDRGNLILEACGLGANAAGRLKVRETAALLRHCRLFLGNDSGPMHLAAAVGVPCVAIFAAIDWAGAWYPFGDENVIFRKNVTCEGCRSPHCSNGLICLTAIGTDEVYEACKDLLRKRNG
jgi:ADP-heptose:LPS heptosyltransferase